MYKLDKGKEQDKVVSTVQTKEYHLFTTDDLEFTVRVEDAWDWINYYTNLSEDGRTILKSFRLLKHEDDSDRSIIDFFDSIEERLDELEN